MIIDDFALTALGAAETLDNYELVVERHRSATTVLTSNRDPSEWLAVMADPLRAQSAVDRMKSAAWELVIDGESYRKNEKTPSARTPRSLHRQSLDSGSLDMPGSPSDDHAGRLMWTRSGPMLLATRVVPWDWQVTTWRNVRHELDRMHLVTMESVEGRVAQRSATTTGQAEILSALAIPEPGRFLDFELPTTPA